MSQDGNVIQDRLTKREDGMVQEGITTMDKYTSGNGRMVKSTQKEGGMSCKRTGLTHSSKSNMIKMKKKSTEN